MARTTATNFGGALQFPYATSGTDLFKKEDVQTLAQAVDQHNHSSGKGLVIAPPAGSIPGSALAPGSVTGGAGGIIAGATVTGGAGGNLAANTVATANMVANSISQVVGAQTLGVFIANSGSTTSASFVNVASPSLITLNALGGYAVLVVAVGAVSLTSAGAVAVIGIKNDGVGPSLVTRVAPLVANTAAPFMVMGIFGAISPGAHTFQLAWNVSTASVAMDTGSSMVMYAIELLR